MLSLSQLISRFGCLLGSFQHQASRKHSPESLTFCVCVRSCTCVFMYVQEKPRKGGYSEEAYCWVLYVKLIKNNRVLRLVQSPRGGSPPQPPTSASPYLTTRASPALPSVQAWALSEADSEKDVRRPEPWHIPLSSTTQEHDFSLGLRLPRNSKVA